MIIEFGAKNFLSFKEGVEISFELGKPGTKAVSNHQGLSHILCVKGKNGAGKTNVLQLLAFLRYINYTAFNCKPDDLIQVSSFFYNNDPIDIFIVFQIDEVIYEYNLSLTHKGIISETLFLGREQGKVLFAREENKIVKINDQYSDLMHMKLRKNVGIISLANQYELYPEDHIFTFFSSFVLNAHSCGFLEDLHTMEDISLFYHNNPEMFSFCKAILKASDIGISDIELIERTSYKGDKIYEPIFTYWCDTDKRQLGFFEQSSGTKKLYKSLFHYFWALTSGGIAVLDELDLHIHPHLVPKLFELFENKTINKNNAQLIFTSHLTEIIDSMGKYRTYIVDKEDNESSAYRLDETEDILIRNDRPISPLYDKGLLGGVPKL